MFINVLNQADISLYARFLHQLCVPTVEYTEYLPRVSRENLGIPHEAATAAFKGMGIPYVLLKLSYGHEVIPDMTSRADNIEVRWKQNTLKSKSRVEFELNMIGTVLYEFKSAKYEDLDQCYANHIKTAFEEAQGSIREVSSPSRIFPGEQSSENMVDELAHSVSSFLSSKQLVMMNQPLQLKLHGKYTLKLDENFRICALVHNCTRMDMHTLP
jgi:hypothetical protein